MREISVDVLLDFLSFTDTLCLVSESAVDAINKL